MTTNQIIDLYRKSIVSFFYKDYNFEINIEFFNIETPKIVRNENQVKIQIPVMYENIELHDIDKEIQFLLVLSHETAHYLNKHLFYSDRDDHDSKAIELWADYFGNRIFLSICYFSECLEDRYKFKSDFNIFLESYYTALNNMYEAYYSNGHRKYPAANLRYQIGHTSLTSFITKLENGNCFAQRIIKATKKLSELSSIDKIQYSSEANELRELLPRILEVHKEILGNNREVTEGIKEEYKKYIGTHY